MAVVQCFLQNQTFRQCHRLPSSVKIECDNVWWYTLVTTVLSVSYTHLDVYKRQGIDHVHRLCHCVTVLCICYGHRQIRACFPDSTEFLSFRILIFFLNSSTISYTPFLIVNFIVVQDFYHLVPYYGQWILQLVVGILIFSVPENILSLFRVL